MDNVTALNYTNDFLHFSKPKKKKENNEKESHLLFLYYLIAKYEYTMNFQPKLWHIRNELRISCQMFHRDDNRVVLLP